MAYLKVKWRRENPKNQELSASDYERYLLKDQGTKLVATHTDNSKIHNHILVNTINNCFQNNNQLKILSVKRKKIIRAFFKGQMATILWLISRTFWLRFMGLRENPQEFSPPRSYDFGSPKI